MSSPDRPRRMRTSPGPRNNQQRKRPVTQGGVRAMVAKKQ